MTRPIVLLRKDVAPLKWHDPFDSLVAEAEGNADGIRLTEQPTDKAGHWLCYWSSEKTCETVELTPRGWAAYRRGDHGQPSLYQENY